MSDTLMQHSARVPAAGAKAVVAAALAIWFAAVSLLAARGGLVAAPGHPPLSLLLAVVAPIAVFFAALRASPAFRNFIASVDLQLVTSIQAWRTAGFGFIALYAYEVLPGIFAWPAGLGDMAIAVAAPWMAISLARDAGFAASRRYRVWNLLGMADLVIAVSIGAASSMLATGVPGEITTAPMALLPLALVPAYFVPLFLMLHAAALYRSRRPS